MSPDPLVPDFVPDDLVKEHGTPASRRRPARRKATGRRPTRHLRAAPDVAPDAAPDAGSDTGRRTREEKLRRARRREVAAILVAVELALVGVIAIALWWSALASSTQSWLWTAFTYGGWVVAFHLPAVLAVVVLRVIDHADR